MMKYIMYNIQGYSFLYNLSHIYGE